MNEVQSVQHQKESDKCGYRKWRLSNEIFKYLTI